MRYENGMAAAGRHALTNNLSGSALNKIMPLAAAKVPPQKWRRFRTSADRLGDSGEGEVLCRSDPHSTSFDLPESISKMAKLVLVLPRSILILTVQALVLPRSILIPTVQALVLPRSVLIPTLQALALAYSILVMTVQTTTNETTIFSGSLKAMSRTIATRSTCW